MTFIKFTVKNIKAICNKVGISLLLLLAFCAQANNDKYKIGIVVGHTSKNSSKSNTEKMCILKSTTDTLGNKSKNIDIIFVENNRSASGSAQAAMKLIERDVDIAVLPLISKEAEAAASFLTQAEIPFITSATAMDVIQDTKFGLSIMPSNLYQAQLLAAYYLKQGNTNTLHIIKSHSSQYSVEVASEFLRLVLAKRPNINTITHQFTLDSQKEIAHQINDGDTIFAPLFNPYIASFYHELAKTNIKNINMLGPDSIGGRQEFYDIIEEVSPNITLRFLKNWDGKVKGPNKELFKSYASAYCPFEYTSFLSAYSFDLIQLIQSEIAELESVKHKTDALNALKRSKYKTAMDGQYIDINNTGHNKKPMYLYEVTAQGNQKVATLYFSETLNDD